MSKKTGRARQGTNSQGKNRRNSQISLRRLGLMLPAAGGLVAVAMPSAHAFQLYDGSSQGNNLEISLSITTSYSGFYRVQDPSAVLDLGVNNANGNDGDNNLRHGIVGNIFEVLPVLDIKDGNLGMHFSGEYFLNTVYLQKNQNNQPGYVNPVVPVNTDFASETRQANGQNGRMLDAFVYDSFNFANNQSLTLKAGQQTLFWGQSLFFGTNGIAGGQAPLDVIAAQDLVNPESQQVFLPVGQIVATYKPDDTYTLQGYYQYQWEPYSLQGVGSYFSSSDVTGPGGQRILANVPALGGTVIYNQTKALTPESQNGQFGASVQAQYGNYDVGLFGLRYDSKTPVVATITNVTFPPPFFFSTAASTYHQIFPRDIWLYGGSVSTTVGATNVAGELSTRTHMNLVTLGPTPFNLGFANNFAGNANSNPSYPVGNTVTGLISAIYGSPGLSFDPGGITFTGEVEYVDVYRVTANKALLAPGRSSAASAFDVELIPAYFNVLPNLNINFPVSMHYNYAGNSQMDSSMDHGTGTYSAGVSATYRSTWTGSLNYVGYFGKPGPALQSNVAQDVDRGYVTLNLQHTF